MDTYQDLTQKLEIQLDRNPHEQYLATIKQQRQIINKLIATVQEANEQVLTVAGTSEEPDKILAVSRLLSQVLADVAKI